MDYSALAEGQQQQQQYHHQLYQDHHHHQAAAAAYDPSAQSQAQAYDAYYAYHHHHHYDYDPSAYHHYYSTPDYSAAGATYHHPVPPVAAVQSNVGDPASTTAPQDVSQYHPAAVAAAGHNYPPPPQHDQPAGSASASSAAYQMPPGLDPAAAAAVVAFSQLTQFAGTMDAAERAAMAGKQERQWHLKSAHHHSQPQNRRPSQPGVGGRSAYRGGSKRGHGSLRGGSVGGNFSHHPSRHDFGATPRGRGKGRIGRGANWRHHQSAPNREMPDTAAALVTGLSVLEPVLVPAQATRKAEVVAAEAMPRLPRRSLLPIAWCDICRVDCNSLEILEQHKNGKRHKRTVKRIQEIEAQQQLIADIQVKVATNPDVAFQKSPENKVPLSVEPEKASTGLENLPSAIAFYQVGQANHVATASANKEAAAFSAQASEANRGSITEAVTCKVNEANKSSCTSRNLSSASVNIDHDMKSEMVILNKAGKSESAKEQEAENEALESDVPEAMNTPKMGKKRRTRMDMHGPKGKMMRFGQGGKRSRTLEPIRRRPPPERPREQPRVCTLCNIMCDTLAVFECHLSGKKHMSRIKRFQGQNSAYGPITVYIPPNQLTAYPPHAPEPVFYGLKSHELLQQEAYALNAQQIESYGIQQGGQADYSRESRGVVLDSHPEQDLKHPEGKVPASWAKDATNTSTEGQYSVCELEAKDTNQLPGISPPGKSIEDRSSSVVAEDVVAVPEYLPSLGDNFVLPALDAKVEPSA